MPKEKILIVDDERLQRWAVRKQLTGWGYDVVEAADGHSAVEVYSAQMPDLALLDFKLPDETGVEVLRQIKAIDPGAVAIMVTAHGALEDAVAAFRIGLFDFLTKPLDFDALRVAIRYGLEARRLRAEVHRWRETDRRTAGDAIVGQSRAILDAVALMRKVAASGATTVLLTGESGTGKDLFAKAIHYGSPRSSGPFIAVNCAAIPETLLEAELFGYEKGAFTDARALKKGVFELADGGTLYLDEISELKPGLQAKLLRVLETLTFRRVGGTRDVSVDVRIIAATNRDLEEAVRTGHFRADLLYRLRVIELKLPPLRSHREDVPALVDHFIREFNVKLRKAVTGITPEAMRLLVDYTWPGNVRELKNAIERAMILEDTDRLTPAHLPVSVDSAARASRDGLRGLRDLKLPPEGASLEAVEEELVRQAMELAAGNQSRAARLLDISRDTLRYKLKKFGLVTQQVEESGGEETRRAPDLQER